MIIQVFSNSMIFPCMELFFNDFPVFPQFPGLPLTFKSRKSRLPTLEIWKSHWIFLEVPLFFCDTVAVWRIVKLALKNKIYISEIIQVFHDHFQSFWEPCIKSLSKKLQHFLELVITHEVGTLLSILKSVQQYKINEKHLQITCALTE